MYIREIIPPVCTRRIKTSLLYVANNFGTILIICDLMLLQFLDSINFVKLVFATF
jgi:hypothetical protein